jgi:HK97 family phage prohead protease/HK97 family phage major capsid protein
MDKEQLIKPDKTKDSGIAFKVLDTKAEDKWIIEGYASTPDLDSYKEIVLPSAFAEGMPKYDKFPIVLVNHLWGTKPVGQVVSWEIQDKGLWVKVEISKTTEGRDVWTLIQDGVLKAFSIGFYLQQSEADEETGVTTLTKVQLVELSIVNVPANTQALFASAKMLGLKSFANYKTSEPPNTQGEAAMDLEEIKKEVKTAVDAKTIDVTAKAAEAVGAVVEPKITAMKETIDTLIANAKQAAESCATKAEQAELVAKLTAVEEKLHLVDEQQRKAVHADGPQYKADVLMSEEATTHKLNRINPDYGKALFTPSRMFSGTLAEKHRAFCEAHDNLAFLHAMLDGMKKHSRGFNYPGPEKLKSFAEWEGRREALFGKAMSSTTGYGGELIPSDLSANLTEKIELAAIVTPMFEEIQLPTKVYTVPFVGTRPTVYNFDEQTGDFATEARKSTPTTGSNTMTAKGFAVATNCSVEETEDSIIPVLGMIQNTFIRAWAEAMDDAIVNGDKTTVHRDTGFTTTGYSTLLTADVRRNFDGLRHQANADSAEYDCKTATALPNTADFELADFVKVLQLMGPAAQPERYNDLFILMSLARFWTLMLFDEHRTVDKFGMSAANVAGPIMRVLGIPVYATSYLRNDYTSAGLYTGTGTASVFLIVNKTLHKRGSKRTFTIESQKNILTQQFELVGTARKSFDLLRTASTEIPVGAGINVPTTI